MIAPDARHGPGGFGGCWSCCGSSFPCCTSILSFWNGNVYPVLLSSRGERLPLVPEGCRDVWKRWILHDKIAMSPWGPGTECHILNAKYPPIGSCIWTYGPQLVRLFWKAVTHLRGRAWLLGAVHEGAGIGLWSPSSTSRQLSASWLSRDHEQLLLPCLPHHDGLSLLKLRAQTSLPSLVLTGILSAIKEKN